VPTQDYRATIRTPIAERAGSVVLRVSHYFCRLRTSANVIVSHYVHCTIKDRRSDDPPPSTRSIGTLSEAGITAQFGPLEMRIERMSGTGDSRMGWRVVYYRLIVTLNCFFNASTTARFERSASLLVTSFLLLSKARIIRGVTRGDTRYRDLPIILLSRAGTRALKIHHGIEYRSCTFLRLARLAN